MGYAGASSTADMLQLAVGRHSVVSCEELFRANVWVRDKTWYASMDAQLDLFFENVARVRLDNIYLTPTNVDT